MSRPASSTTNNTGNELLIQELQQKLEQYITPDFGDQTSAIAGEEPAGIKDAAMLIIRIILMRFTTLPVMSMDAEGLYQAAKEFAGMNLRQPPASYIDNGYVLMKGSGILADLFGDHYGSTVNAVSITARVKSSTVHTVMCLLASFSFHELGLIAGQRQLSQQLLLAQLRLGFPVAMKGLPEKLFPFLDWFRPAALPVVEETAIQNTIIRTPNQTSSQRWIMTISLLLLAMMLVILFIRSRKTSATPPVSGSAKDAVQVVGIRYEEIE
ncbi:DUF937 domain-containing protein [Terrimonas ferruginea]|uniref:DUF937 domain-containing protein n=1 Tax=Terrimonas ferruginea TaxID=249 RepID=UPI00040829CC|nr:DUF937 domain-containing protein [Terrimonas ferruginea]